MKTTRPICRLILAHFVMGFFLSPIGVLAGEVYKVEGSEVEVTVIPDKKEIMIGEPIYLSFTVSNHSDKNLQLIEGGDYRNRLGRPESYSVIVTRQDGKKIPNPDAGESMGGTMGPQKVPAKGDYVKKLFLPHWARFEEVGDYSIVCKRAFKFSEYTLGKWDEKEKTTELAVQASTTVRVSVLHQLAKIKSDKALSMIREMTKDQNKIVSDEAKRYLKELTSDSKNSP